MAFSAARPCSIGTLARAWKKSRLLRLSIYMHMHVYIYVYICIYTYMHIYVYTHTYTHIAHMNDLVSDYQDANCSPSFLIQSDLCIVYSYYLLLKVVLIAFMLRQCCSAL